jgi:hypothetical protein
MATEKRPTHLRPEQIVKIDLELIAARGLRSLTAP